MESIRASGFVNHGNNLQLYQSPAAVFSNFPRNFDIDSLLPGETRRSCLECLVVLRIDCEGLGLIVTLAKVNQLIEKLERRISFREVENDCHEIFDRLGVELDARLFLALDPKHARLYSDFASDWDRVTRAFTSVGADIEEASKCLALNRYTACVFHLMRVAEAALASIAKRIGLVNTRPGWEEAITYIEGQLDKKRAEMDAMFKGDVNFLRETAAHMRDVNIAWRRRVAHIESKYTEEEAARILAATKGLMEHMATKLSEVDGESL